MEHETSQLAKSLHRSLTEFEADLQHRISPDALERVLIASELLRGRGTREAMEIAEAAMEWCAELIMAAAARDLVEGVSPGTAMHWWLLGQKMMNAGYPLPERFETDLIDRAHRLFLKATIAKLRGHKAAGVPGRELTVDPRVDRNSISQQRPLATLVHR